MTTETEYAAAAGRARRMYPRSRGFQGAYKRGALARLNGASADACPYKRDAHKTWRQSFRLAWLRGYQSIGGEG